MTLIFEISKPWQWKPGLHSSSSMLRVWWGPIAVSYLRVSFPEFTETSYYWFSR